MNKIKEALKSPYMMFGLFFIKLLVYYILIDVNIVGKGMPLISAGILGVLFWAFSRSRIKKKSVWFLSIYFLLSLLMFADSMYYNYYNQTVSIKQIWQASNVAKVPSSFIATLIPASFLLFVDLPLAWYYFKRDIKLSNGKRTVLGKKNSTICLVAGMLVLVLSTNPVNSTAVAKINSVEFFTNHISDIYRSVKDSIVTSDVSAEEVMDTVDEVVKQAEGIKYRGIAKNKNLVVIQIEAFQNFLINREYNGEEITPNLNKLIKENSLYFDNYYCNIGKGNTADAEFSTLNSLYPVIDGESYRLYVDNIYNGLPWLLKDEGYTTMAVHGYEGDFWNRRRAYPYQGIDAYYAEENLKQDDIIGLGISDKSMFKQTIDILKKEEQPFFSFIVTLTNHHPFLLDEEDATLQLKEEDKDTKLGSYLRTARYTDEAIGQFIEDLKAEGLYEDTVIALYGDHHGLNCKMEEVQEPMKNLLGRDYDFDEMLKVPLIIHIPGSGVQEKISTVGGQVDFLPTISNLMSLEVQQPFVLGQDLVNTREGFVAFTAYMFEGSFAKDGVMFEISREGVFEGSRAWEIGTGKELNADLYRKDYEKAIKLKETSEVILEQNMMENYIGQ